VWWWVPGRSTPSELGVFPHEAASDLTM